MTTLSILQIYQAARAAGFTPEQATTWTAIALAESHGNPHALNPTGEHSEGLWQINLAAHSNEWGNLYNPLNNARAAYAISHGGTDMRPWTTTHTGGTGSAPYMQYLPNVEAVTGVQGDGRGVVGYGSPLNPPLPGSGSAHDAAPPLPTIPSTSDPAPYDQIDLGNAPGSRLDSDHDGLTNAFERAAGTNPMSADSDHDGLPDAYEIGVSHSDPTVADTDHDGLSDSTEVALGTSPTSWDTDNDGLSDQVEVRYGTDPLHADAGDGVVPTPTSAPAPPGTLVATPQVSSPTLTGTGKITEPYQRVTLHPQDAYHRFHLGTDSSGRPLTLNGRTIAMLDEADQRLGFNLDILQGSYQTDGAAASAGTHDGGGAIDVRTSDMTPQQLDRTVLVLRQIGFAAWHRTTADFDVDHIHAVAIGDHDLSSEAQAQVVSYRAGGDGLAGGGMDNGPHVPPVTFNYEAALMDAGSAHLASSMAPHVTDHVSAMSTASAPGGETRVHEFVQAALAQRGDSYVFGHEVNLHDPNPNAFDCSELTQWAAAQAGVTIPDGAMYQYLDLKSSHHLIPVEQAIHTPGALLFHFSSEPTQGGARPTEAHVAISLGNGKTIEAANPQDGVREFPAAGRFEFAGVIPGLSAVDPHPSAPGLGSGTGLDPTSGAQPADPWTLAYDAMYGGAPPTTPADSDHDGLSNAFEKLAHLNPHSADTDHDGLSDAQEALQTHTDPLSADTDHDGRPDAMEVAAGTDPGHLPGVAGVVGQGQFALDARHGLADSDHDGLPDAYELRIGSDPHSADSDHDGLSDGTEVALGTDPTSADTDHDGLTDPFEVRFGLDPLHAPTPGGLSDPMAPGVDDPLATGPDGLT